MHLGHDCTPVAFIRPAKRDEAPRKLTADTWQSTSVLLACFARILTTLPMPDDAVASESALSPPPSSPTQKAQFLPEATATSCPSVFLFATSTVQEVRVVIHVCQPCHFGLRGRMRRVPEPARGLCSLHQSQPSQPIHCGRRIGGLSGLRCRFPPRRCRCCLWTRLGTCVSARSRRERMWNPGQKPGLRVRKIFSIWQSKESALGNQSEP